MADVRDASHPSGMPNARSTQWNTVQRNGTCNKWGFLQAGSRLKQSYPKLCRPGHCPARTCLRKAQDR